MLLLDTSGVLAALFPDQRDHAECSEVLRAARGDRLLSPFVLAELDCLVAKHAGVDAELALLDELVRGAYRLVDFGDADIASARDVIANYDALQIGLADASIVVLSVRFKCLDVLTLDERHFRALRGHAGKKFRILPADL
jgi:predicted nucleic acid-binding protein